MQKNENASDELLKLLQEQKLSLKEILNLSETAQYLGITKSYLYKLTSKNKIPFYRPNGKLLYFKKIELDAWLTKNRQSSIDEIDNRATNYVMNLKSSHYGKE
jgi:excisionase family DNA binding protein